ncbi:MAG: Glu/Leu/Phe/Val dehydrogenase dimerization domain-containing protein [Chlamydiota bacterium]
MALVLDEALELEEMVVPGYEKVVKITHKEVGLNAIVSIHTTLLGPALGGTRIYPYSTFDAALTDVMRLSRGMTYKSALAQAGWGGGKSVIIADPKKDKTEELLLAFGHAIDRLQGQYICAEDVGCTPQDVLTISRATPYVVGLPHEKSSGNPSPFTAWGTYRGIQSVAQKLYGTDSLEHLTIAVQGLGSVGTDLALLLFWAGARLIVSDIDPDRCRNVAKLTGAKVVSIDEILKVECDILAPCAMGGIINEQTIGALRCKGIAGCANNQLLHDSDANELLARKILYAPDFVINSGGLINVTEELDPKGYQPLVARDKVHKIYDELMVIYDIAEQNRFSTHSAAVSLADYRLKYGIGKRIEPPCFNHAK